MKKKTKKLYIGIFVFFVVCLVSVFIYFNVGRTNLGFHADDTFRACEIYIQTTKNPTTPCAEVNPERATCLRNVAVAYEHEWIYTEGLNQLYPGRFVAMINDADWNNNRVKEAAADFCIFGNYHGYTFKITENFDRNISCKALNGHVDSACGPQQLCLLQGCTFIPNDCSVKGFECGSTTVKKGLSRDMDLVCGVCDVNSDCVNNKCVKKQGSDVTIENPVLISPTPFTPATVLDEKEMSLEQYLLIGIIILSIIVIILIIMLVLQNKRKR